MKQRDLPRLKEQILSMLPVTQSEVWKVLGISSKDGSELIGYMLDENLIKRTSVNVEGKRTYLLESANGKGRAKKIDFSILLSGDTFSPCCGCEVECEPAHCMRLMGWVTGNHS